MLYLGIVAHTYNSIAWEVEAGGVKFWGRLDYLVGPCQKRNGERELGT